MQDSAKRRKTKEPAKLLGIMYGEKTITATAKHDVKRNMMDKTICLSDGQIFPNRVTVITK